jgi:O-antigen/teichoic acid export membrane protein
MGQRLLGLLGTFTAIVAAAVPLAALAYPIAIVLPRNDSEALGVARLAAILSFAVALLVSVALVVGGDWLIATLGAEAVGSYLFLIPVAMLFAAWMQIAQQWLIRKKEFGVVARSAVTHSLLLNSAKVGIGWLHPVAGVLIVLAAIGNFLHAALLFIGARRRYSQPSCDDGGNSRPALEKLANRYRDFPLYRAPQNFINAISQSLPVLLLAAFFGPAAAGFYTLAKMVMGAPSTLLGKAVTDVFYPRITEAAHNGENLAHHIIRATGILFAVGIVPFGLVMVFGPWLFGLVFGGDWVVAGEYARWLSLFFLFNFINKPSVAAVPVLGIQPGLLLYELFSTGGKVIGLVAGFYWMDSDIWAIALFSIVGVAAYSWMITWIYLRARGWRDNAKTSR